jgi:hypothetical protein
MANAKLTKKEIDEKVLELLKLKEQQSNTNKRISELVASLEGQYTSAASEPETIKGIQTEFVKIPVNSGRNNYDTSKLKPFLTAIGAFRKAIKKVIVVNEVIDTKVLDTLIKTGKLAPENLDACRIDKWTFRSDFRRIEAVAQTKAPEVEKVGTKRKVAKVEEAV